jgi:hypothetical protein
MDEAKYEEFIDEVQSVYDYNVETRKTSGSILFSKIYGEDVSAFKLWKRMRKLPSKLR